MVTARFQKMYQGASEPKERTDTGARPPQRLPTRTIPNGTSVGGLLGK